MSDALFELLSRVGRRSTRAGHARARPLLGAGSRDPQRSARRASSGGISLFHDRDADAELGITSREAKEPTEAASFYVLALVHYFVSYASLLALALVASA